MKIGATQTSPDYSKTNFTRNKKSNLNNAILYNAGRALEAGVITAGIDYLLTPRDVKQAIKFTLRGEDKFISDFAKTADNIIQKSGEVISKDKIIKDGKSVFEPIAQKAAPAMKRIGKTFAGVAAVVFVGNIISDYLIDKKVNNK